MSRNEPDLIIQHRSRPRIVELWRALARLQSIVSFMSSGAHPDDEKSSMLAALSLRDGLDLSYACSTRGDGGQNDIGTESGAALGVLRTAEMESACEVLDLTQYWLSEHPDDPIIDFGFSKSGKETLNRWGYERTLRRFVEIVRTEKPDILCPTFLDVPGQHGHHRAMTEMARLVMDYAADSTYDTGQPVWQIKKLFLPAWSGAGQSYDDDLPPPPETTRISGIGRDPVTGFSYEQIGQQSRVFHRTQGMGRWMPPGSGHDWPLHLADCRVDTDDSSLCSGLPVTLRDLGLDNVQAHFDAARNAFPDVNVILQELSAGIALLKKSEVPDEFTHKTERKMIHAARVVRIAAGVELDATLSRTLLKNGDSTIVELSLDADVDGVETRVLLPEGWSAQGATLQVEDAEPSRSMPDYYSVDYPSRPCIEVSVKTHGVVSQSYMPFREPPLVLPTKQVTLDRRSDIVNLSANQRSLRLKISSVSPSTYMPELITPEGWTSTFDNDEFTIDVGNATPGNYELPLLLGGEAAQTCEIIGQNYDHVSPRSLTRPACMRVHVIDCALPKAKIAYIGGGNDSVDYWLQRAGFDVTRLSIDEWLSGDTQDQFDSLIIGIMAIKFHKGLSDNMVQIHQWIEAGGNLLTLYHRPWDNWDPAVTPPKSIQIGQPSLRWRVTDQNASVRQLIEHPILSIPNKISDADWQGWYKERGLYFAKQWDASYTPLVEMADPDESPLQGSLLTARIGKGQHSHCALILHHQLAHGVGGAYRLMANLLETQ